MTFLVANLILLVLVAALFWWLSGYDSRLSGNHEVRDYVRRAVRAAVSVVIVECAFHFLWRYAHDRNVGAGWAYLAAGLSLAIIWCGPLSHLGAQLFRSLIDPDDTRGFHPDQEARLLEQIAMLIRSEKKDEAILMCNALKASGEVSPAALDMTLAHLGVTIENAGIDKPLATAHRLRLQGEFEQAISILKSLLNKNPRNVDAAMPLMRIYAQDLRRPDKARQVLEDLGKQPHVSRAHLDFALNSITEWSQSRQPPPVPSQPAASIDELVSHGFIGTAIETLEEQVEAKPEDFDLQLKLAGLYARHANNIPAAERVVRQMQNRFSPEQLELARAQLWEWQKQSRAATGH
jgi:tetratricopeptide (TPR) repeat protein